MKNSSIKTSIVSISFLLIFFGQNCSENSFTHKNDFPTDRGTNNPHQDMNELQKLDNSAPLLNSTIISNSDKISKILYPNLEYPKELWMVSSFFQILM